jgi:regulator of sigma E protease
MATLKTVLIIIEVLLLFNLLIAVHELGHFLAAKWRGLKIERFAIWFGKPLWKKKINGVEFALGWIPAGGYVALPQMATMEAIEGKSEDSEVPPPPISALDKIIVAFAGPLFSFLLAVVFAVVVWAVGKPVNEADNSPMIGWVDTNGPAWNAGLRAGDTILEIDGRPVTKFAAPARDSVMWRIITSEDTNIVIKYRRDGGENMAYVVPMQRTNKWYERKALRQILVSSAIPAIIFDVASNSPAAQAGLRYGDQVIAVNGQKVYSYMPVVAAQDAASNNPAQPVILTVRRDKEEFERAMLVEKPVQPTNSSPSLGILAWLGRTNVTISHPSPVDQICESSGQIFATLGAVLSPKTHIGVQQLGGAVMIVRLYTNLFQSEYGWRLVLWFSVVLNVNLAMLNLLPLPVLDGGHIVLALLELIRRRPVSARFLQFVQTAFAMVLIVFMVYIAFFDTGDWIRHARQDREVPVVFAPK